MAEETLSEIEFYDLLRDQEIAGTIEPGFQKVLDFAVDSGNYNAKTPSEVVLKFVKSPYGQIGIPITAEVGGEIAVRKAADLALDVVNPLKKVGLVKKGAQGLASLLGIGGGNIASQKILRPDQPIDVGETKTSMAFGLAGLGAASAVHKLRVKNPDYGNFEGARVGQTTKPVALEAVDRLDAVRTQRFPSGIAARVSLVLRGQYFKIMDGLASTVPPASGSRFMGKVKRTIQEFYEDEIGRWGPHIVDNMPKMHLSQLAKDLVSDAVALVRRTSQRQFRELDDLIESGVDLRFMGKGENVSFKAAGELLDKAGKSDFKQIRKQMKSTISEHIAATAKQLRLQSKKDLKEAMRNIKGTPSDTPANRKFVEEFIKKKGDIPQMTKDLKHRVDYAILFSKKYQNKIAKTFVETLARKQPEVFLEAFMKPQGPETLKIAMGMLTPELRRHVRSALIGKISIDDVGGFLQAASTMGPGAVAELNGRQLLKNIAAWERGFGTKMAYAMFPGTGLNGLKQLAKELSVFQFEGLKIGSVAAFLLVPSAAMGIATGLAAADVWTGAFATAFGIIFIPLRYAYKFNDPKFVRRMTGLAVKAGESTGSAERRALVFISQLAAEGVEVTYVANDPLPVSGTGRHELTQ